VVVGVVASIGRAHPRPGHVDRCTAAGDGP